MNQIADFAYQKALNYGVPPDLLLAMIDQESSWKLDAYNEISGAAGVLQIVSSKHPEDQFGNVLDPYDWYQAISYAAYMMKVAHDHFIYEVGSTDSDEKAWGWAAASWHMGVDGVDTDVADTGDITPRVDPGASTDSVAHRQTVTDKRALFADYPAPEGDVYVVNWRTIGVPAQRLCLLLSCSRRPVDPGPPAIYLPARHSSAPRRSRPVGPDRAPSSGPAGGRPLDPAFPSPA